MHYCREGNYCDNTGQAASNVAQNTAEQQCVDGTYMPRLGAEVVGDCVTCPGGYMCETPTGQVVQTGPITPIICPTGSFCPKGSEGTGCPGGDPLLCPQACTAGNYCPA